MDSAQPSSARAFFFAALQRGTLTPRHATMRQASTPCRNSTSGEWRQSALGGKHEPAGQDHDEHSRWSIRLMPYVRDRTCRNCGKIETVRKDNSASQCKACASSAAGSVTALKRKAEANRKPCRNCAQPVKAARATFCSVQCRSAASRTTRECRHCGTQFIVLKSALKTNASGNFCSRPCYERYLCNSDRVTGRGSQWNKIRSEVLASFPFCAVCGTTKSLQVHHIIPFRLTRDNSKSNLVPLCIKHHRWVETMFVDTERFGVDAITQEVWRGMIRSKQAITATKIRGIARELAI